MGVSFWERAQQLRIGRQTSEAAGEALRRPFEEAGFRMSPGVLDRLADESQGYPFFVQLIGDAVWRRMDSRSEVTPEAMEAGCVDFGKRKGEFHARRHEELASGDLIPVARSVADAFRDRLSLTREELEKAIRAGLRDSGPAPERVLRAAAALRELGFLWRVEGRTEWEPGIPSLMDYVREHVAAG